MGFVFNVENYIENNINVIQETVFEGIDLFKDKKTKLVICININQEQIH